MVFSKKRAVNLLLNLCIVACMLFTGASVVEQQNHIRMLGAVALMSGCVTLIVELLPFEQSTHRQIITSLACVLLPLLAVGLVAFVQGYPW